MNITSMIVVVTTKLEAAVLAGAVVLVDSAATAEAVLVMVEAVVLAQAKAI